MKLTERQIVSALARTFEKKLPYECRYKMYDVLENEVIWVTQESSNADGAYAAEVIAGFIREAGVIGFTVKVTIRDYYRGEDTLNWQGIETS